jgi:hypothetical protein
MFRVSLLVPTLIGALACAAPAVAGTEADLDGVYICNGINPDGSPYRGIVQIAKHENTFYVRWVFGGKVAAVGIGIRSGDVLAVANYSGVPGVVVYKIDGDAGLIGEWTVDGADGAVFSETLTRAPADTAAPTAPPPDSSQTPQPGTPERPHRRERIDQARGLREI